MTNQVQFEFKKQEEPIPVGDFWYDLTDGGYIKPEKLLTNPDQIKLVKDAIALLKAYEDQAGGAGAIESM
jgi:hypothetical protein